MNLKKLLLFNVIALLLAVIISSCFEKDNDSSKIETVSTLSKTELENEAWQMEEKYWEYVQI